MRLTPSIFSTLKTWVFKRKLLRFSDRYRRDPMACFYCPEMCRFSCPVAEALRTDTVTPRGKMSLLHLAERGFAVERVAGSEENREWVLEQCSGCGRCTEYCKWEVDVGSNLRQERARHFEKAAVGAGIGAERLAQLAALKGTVLLCEPQRKHWWEGNLKSGTLSFDGLDAIAEVELPAREWAWGKLQAKEAKAIARALSGCSELWVESPEVAWFLAKGLKEEAGALKPKIRLVWQKYFPLMASITLGPDVSFHESFHLARLFPRIGYSIPMYEKGFMPFHHGWNMIDCGGEGYFHLAHPHHAMEMGRRFLFDLGKDGRSIRKIVCQNLSCIEHLRPMARGVTLTYWLDEIAVGGER